MKNYQRIWKLSLAVLGTFWIALNDEVRASVIIEDFFTRTGALNGSTANTGQTWSGSGWTTDGNELNTSGSTASLINGLTFLPNTIYTLTIDVSLSAGGSDWIGFGFTTSGGNPASNSRGFMLHRGNPEVQFFSSGTGGDQSAPSTSPFPNTMEIELTTGATLSNSTLTYRLNGTVVGSGIATNASTIDSVFIQNIGGATGTVDNFELRRSQAVQTDTFLAGTPNQFNIDFVVIREASNPPDTDNPQLGQVPYEYRIAKHEIQESLIQAYNLTHSGSSLEILIDSRGLSKPATDVSWNEAARFVNWLNSLEGFPDAYKFTTNGANDNISLWTSADAGFDASNPFRNSNARYVLPSMDEWYKAAYYDGCTNTYFNHATGSDTAPTSIASGTAPGTAVYGNAWEVGPADTTEAGGLSPYGTMAQGGNVLEWCETAVFPPNDSATQQRRAVGGLWNSNAATISNNYVSQRAPSENRSWIGFRVASLLRPEITVEQVPGDELESGEAVVDFGNVLVGGEGSVRTFSICNQGSASLTGLLAELSGDNLQDYMINTDLSGVILQPNECVTVDVTFNPSGVGVGTATLEIASNDADENPFLINLTGIGEGNPPTDIDLDSNLVDENQIAGTLVGNLSATDADQTTGFTYVLVAGAGDDDNACFSISGDELLTTKPFDAEGQNTFSILVNVTDENGNTYEEIIIILVGDDRNEDCDGDGLTEAEEEDLHGTSDKLADSDGDGYDDNIEVEEETDPTDENAYPCLPVTWQQVQKLLASDGPPDGFLGFSVSLSGNIALVGAAFDDSNGNSSGSAYLFDVNTGVQLHKLVPLDGTADDYFGHSVSISGDVALVGAWGDDDQGSASGSAYLFNVDTGQQIRKLLPNIADAGAGDRFGISVSLSGDLALIGAETDDDHGDASGSAYLFDVDTGQQIRKLLPDADTAEGFFGHSVSLYGHRALVGASGGEHQGVRSGIAYIFDVTPGAAGPGIRKIFPADGAEDDAFGSSVSLFANRCLIGAFGHGDSGAAYVCEVATGGQVQKLVTGLGAASDRFGFSVSLSGNLALVGAWADDGNGALSGSAYVFNATTGVELQEIVPNDGDTGDRFGYSVALSGGVALIGASEDDDNGARSGSAYVFDRLNQVPTDIGIAPDCVDENLPAGTMVGQLSAVDVDQSPIHDFVYTLVSGAGSEDNGRFSIGGAASDELLTGESFDQEAKATYTIRVRVTDCNGGVYEEIIVITIKDDRTEDADGDGLTEAQEEDLYGTSDELTDTDGDGFDDGWEVERCSNPADINSVPLNGGNREWECVQRVLENSGEDYADVGSSVSISGRFAIIGDRYGDGAIVNSGTASIFERVGGVWVFRQLLSVAGTGQDWFGDAVSISGNTALVGAPRFDDGGFGHTDSGTAYLFRRDPTTNTWSIDRRFKPNTEGASFDYFGSAVAVSGDTVVVGSKFDDHPGGASNSGSVYFYKRDASGVWGEPKKFIDEDVENSFFGCAVSVTNNYALVGGYGLDSNGSASSGSVFIYERNGSGDWELGQKLLASDRPAGHQFGYSVSVSGQTALIGAPGEWESDDPGRAYVYVRTQDGGWVEEEILSSAPVNAKKRFGLSVGISGDTALVGDYAFSGGAGEVTAREVSFFQRDPSDQSWSLHKVFEKGKEAEDKPDLFDISVAISGEFAITGYPTDGDDLGRANGSAYFFELSAYIPLPPVGIGLVPAQPWPFSPTHACVNENEAVGTLVGVLTGDDPDQADGFTFELVPGPGSQDNDSFTINGNQLLTDEVFDYEVKATYHFRIRVTDCTGRSYEQKLHMHVCNVLFELISYHDTVVGLGEVAGASTWLPQSDPFGRGIANGVAYGLALPLTGTLAAQERARLPIAKGAQGGAIMEFWRPVDVPDDVTYVIQVSSNLGAGEWQTLAWKEGDGAWVGDGAGSVLEMEPVNGLIAVCTQIPTTPKGANFMRLWVEVAE